MNKRLAELSIDEARREKWRVGREKYGRQFVGDPLEELDSELIDAMNYVDEAERQGLIDAGKAREWLIDLRMLCEQVRAEM